MKKIILLSFFAMFLTTFSYAKGIPIPVCVPCESIYEVKDLPDEEALLESGSYLNLGYLYNEYGAVFVTIWNTTGKYVLINKAKTTYYEITDEQLAAYKKAYNLDLPSNPLSFWKKIGGKIVIAVILAIFFLVKLGSDDEEEEPTS